MYRTGIGPTSLHFSYRWDGSGDTDPNYNVIMSSRFFMNCNTNPIINSRAVTKMSSYQLAAVFFLWVATEAQYQNVVSPIFVKNSGKCNDTLLDCLIIPGPSFPPSFLCLFLWLTSYHLTLLIHPAIL